MRRLPLFCLLSLTLVGQESSELVQFKFISSANRGDLFVHIAIDVPKKLTKRQRELLEEFAKESGDTTSEHKSTVQKLKDWLHG